jgi:hypothetical protein
MPYVQTFEKLCRGELSVRLRVLTFLSTARYFETSNVAGSTVLPSDFASRNAPICNNLKCHICTFVQLTEHSVVRHVSTQAIINGTINHCFTSKTAWMTIQ